jgi:hypothetical protein
MLGFVLAHVNIKNEETQVITYNSIYNTKAIIFILFLNQFFTILDWASFRASWHECFFFLFFFFLIEVLVKFNKIIGKFSWIYTF